jgi:hypothetical protein
VALALAALLVAPVQAGASRSARSSSRSRVAAAAAVAAGAAVLLALPLLAAPMQLLLVRAAAAAAARQHPWEAWLLSRGLSQVLPRTEQQQRRRLHTLLRLPRQARTRLVHQQEQQD